MLQRFRPTQGVGDAQLDSFGTGFAICNISATFFKSATACKRSSTCAFLILRKLASLVFALRVNQIARYARVCATRKFINPLRSCLRYAQTHKPATLAFARRANVTTRYARIEKNILTSKKSARQ